LTPPLDISVAVSSNVVGSIFVNDFYTGGVNFSVDGGNLGYLDVTTVKACSLADPIPGVTLNVAVISGISSIITIGGTTTNGSGKILLGPWHAGTVPGLTRVTITAPGANGAVITSGGSRFINHGNPARLVRIAGDEQVAAAGSTLPIAVKLRVEDQFGNPAPNYIDNTLSGHGLPGGRTTIRFNGLTAGTGSVTVQADANGIVTAPLWVLGPTVGLQSVVATDVLLASRTTTFTATATPP
jgi:hypothetical protein